MIRLEHGLALLWEIRQLQRLIEKLEKEQHQRCVLTICARLAPIIGAKHIDEARIAAADRMHARINAIDRELSLI